MQMLPICEELGSEKFNSFRIRWDVWDFTKGSTAKRFCRTPWRQCVIMLYGLRVWYEHQNFLNAMHSRNRFTGHCMGQIARSTCTSSLSLCRYSWVLIRKLHVPLATLPEEKFVERISCKRAKSPNKNFGAKRFSKEPNFCFLAPKEPIWKPCIGHL